MPAFSALAERECEGGGMMANNAMNSEITSKESEGTTAGCTLNASVKTSWRLVKLGEHIDLLTGFPFKSAQYTDNSESIKLLRQIV